MGKKRKRESLGEDSVAENESSEGGDKSEAKDTNDYFFDVRKDLKELFNSAENEGCGFSFLGSELSEDNQPEQTVKESSSLEEIDIAVAEEKKKNEHEEVTYFFFHSDNDALRNRLDENNFVRTRSIAELSMDWPDKRTAMKSSFRKRKKESCKAKKRKYGALASDA